MNQFKRAQVIMLPTNEKPIRGQILRRHAWKEDPKLKCDSLWLYDDTITIDNLKQYTTLNGSFRDWYKAFEPQHLYIISDDEIKENDHILLQTHIHGKELRQVKNIDHNTGIIVCTNNQLIDKDFNIKKIIATTDTSLFMQHPNQCDGCQSNIPLDGNIHREGRELGMTCSKNKYKDYLPEPSLQFITKYIEEYNKGNVITDVLVEYEECFIQNDEEYIHSSGAKGNYSTHSHKLKVNPKDNTITIKKLKDSWNREEVKQLLVDCCGEIYCEDGTLKGKSPGDLYEWIDQNL